MIGGPGFSVIWSAVDLHVFGSLIALKDHTVGPTDKNHWDFRPCSVVHISKLFHHFCVFACTSLWAAFWVASSNLDSNSFVNWVCKILYYLSFEFLMSVIITVISRTCVVLFILFVVIYNDFPHFLLFSWVSFRYREVAFLAQTHVVRCSPRRLFSFLFLFLF